MDLNVVVNPGVAERLDMADPGLGLGLGGALESEVMLAFGFRINGVGALFIFFTSSSSSSSYLGDVSTTNEDFALNAGSGAKATVVVKFRGFFPLSRTFFLALIPTCTSICRNASRSDTGRIRLPVPVLGIVVG